MVYENFFGPESGTQFILISWCVSAAEGVNPVMTNNEMIQCLDVVKNSSLLIDRRLSWKNHGEPSCKSYLCYPEAPAAFFVSRLAHLPFSYIELTDFFCILCGYCVFQFRRLSLAFNACIRYVYSLRRFDHISSFARGLLGCIGCSDFRIRFINSALQLI
jgi:hypothetical protein